MPDKALTFLDGGGKTAELIRAFPWSDTALGPLERWPAGLKTTVALILRSPVPIVTLWGEDGYMIYNDAYSVFAGGRHPRLLGTKVREGWPEVAAFNDNVMKVVMQGGILSYADQELTLHRHGRPEQVWMNLDYSPVIFERGDIAGVIAVVVETSAKVQAEARLRESEAKFRAFAQAMPHHVWTAPADGQLDWFNERVYEYSGVAGGALDADGWAALVHPDDLEAVVQRWREAVAAGSRYDVEFRIRRHDGAYRWHLARALPMLDQDGKVTRWIGSNTDIEDQKSTAQALVSLNATLEEQVTSRTAERDRIWRLSKDLMLIADFEGRLAAVNPAFTATLGWREQEVLGTSLLELIHPDDVQSTVQQIGSLSGGNHVFRFENRYRRKDGSYCTLSWTAVPGDDHINAIGRDITADLQQAEAMRRTEAALQQAQKMETIGKLTGGVAHDFNNLLQVISGNLQLLAPQLADMPVGRRRVENALASVQRGAKLASSLLSFARKQPLEPKVVKVGRLITGMEDMLRRTLGEEIEIETVISGSLWSTAIDVAQVENAILNLAINARDAMADVAEGAGRLTIEVNNALLDANYCATHPDVAPGQYVVIAVSDTGTGMPPEVLQQAFEPFFSTKAEGKGTGLGLSMVYGLVKQSGGHIKIYSEVGEGTTIKLYLPRSRAAEDAYEALDMQPVVGGSETVLVAEDDDAVRATVVEMLTELGYRVLKASDASAALTVIDSGIPIDLLFTDVVMPGPLRSPDMARKAKERLPDLAVLFTSGYTENAIVHGGRLDAGVELIGKPYTKESLARKIRHVLANEKQKQAARANPLPAAVALDPAPAAPSAAAAPGDGTVLKVLLVEDETTIRDNTRDMIEYLGHEVIAVASAEEAMPHLSRDVNVLLTDLQLPGIQGTDLAQLARAQFPDIAVLLASGYGGTVAIPGVRALPKPYTLEMLGEALAELVKPEKKAVVL
ncbi:PAS domain-containing protein [Massilia forsythiae]|uniref:histidine kinase n=1 Tax=Massilia forsythiae TaxID=2728020 RepID=A0A7Z2ZTU8_9BURK|nr:PAS domain-containing protein [Massilia forsythiae]QJE01645.1 PAS domain-containing protein [Massilia forsythiae]